MDYWKCRGRCVDGIRTLDLGKCFSAPNCDVTLDCSATSADCNFDPGTQGYPEHGMADFSPVAPGWSASFDSASAISMGHFFPNLRSRIWYRYFFCLKCTWRLQLLGMLTSGVAFSFPTGLAETVAWFRGH